jgi:hypothetical protein
VGRELSETGGRGVKRVQNLGAKRAKMMGKQAHDWRALGPNRVKAMPHVVEKARGASVRLCKGGC